MAPHLSIVTPAFREAANLEPLYARLVAVLGPLQLEWEWIVVDDHSPDDTFAVIERLAAHDSRVCGLRLSRNGGSHRAILTGLQHARGEAAVTLAGDGQDPPEIIAALVERWRDGARVVWGARREHPGTTRAARWSGKLFHRLMRRLTGIVSLPANGADCMLLDRTVIDALAQFGERNANLFVLVAWLGYQSATIEYDKAPRVAGQSGWTFARKLELLLDSVTAFSYAPIRAMSYIGATTALIGFIASLYVVGLVLAGQPPTGWASIMIVVLLIGGLQMLMLGVLGEYLWRTLDESRRRPRALVEMVTSEAVTSEAAIGEAKARNDVPRREWPRDDAPGNDSGAGAKAAARRNLAVVPPRRGR